jgi:endoglucanase
MNNRRVLRHQVPRILLVVPAVALAFALAAAVMAGEAADPDKDQRMQPAWFKAAVEAGHVKGIRAVELIRPDLLAVTIDAAITRWGNGMGPAGEAQRPENFTVSSATDTAFQSGVRPATVGRESFARFNGVAHGPFSGKTVWWHTYYLSLPKPLASGHAYTVAVAGIEAPFTSQADFAYDERRTTSKAIKINQCGYSSKAKVRFAYLGWWSGDLGPVDYSAFKRFAAIDEATEKTVLEGEVRPRTVGDVDFSGEDVYEMDLSALGPGRYHVRVPGLGRSETFVVGDEGLRDLYYHTMRAFFHQRCGQEFREPWTWVKKPACHVEVWESGHLVEGPGKIYCLWRKETPYDPKPGEKKQSFRGGYHDAADFDVFIYHLPDVSQFLAAYEMCPEAFKDKDLNLPESGNGVPDILDEAAWGLLFWVENQNADGSVPMGRGNECDAFKQQCGGRFPPYGLLPCRRSSAAPFAATASQFARLVRPFNAALADKHLAAAKKAYRWARANEGDLSGLDEKGMKKEQENSKVLLAWAAAELFLTTADPAYNENFLADHRAGVVRHWWLQPIRFWPYLLCKHRGVDKEVQAWMLGEYRRWADVNVDKLAECPYRMSNGRFDGAAWGSAQGVPHNDLLLRLYYLTGEQKYLDAASLNADWHLGCNPLSKTFLTGMGYRHPMRPEISWFLYEGGRDDMKGRTVKGLAIYGIGPRIKTSYPSAWPSGRSSRDVWGFGAEIWNEFTVHQCLGPSAMTYAVLYALEHGLAPQPKGP